MPEYGFYLSRINLKLCTKADKENSTDSYFQCSLLSILTISIVVVYAPTDTITKHLFDSG